MRNLILATCSFLAIAVAQTASAARYITSDLGMRPFQISQAIETYGAQVTVFCRGFSDTDCATYGAAGATLVLNESKYSANDVLAIIEKVSAAERITYVSNGLDGFDLSLIAQQGVYLDIEAQVNVGASEMKSAVQAAPVKSRVKCHVKNASISDSEAKELSDLGATVVL